MKFSTVVAWGVLVATLLMVMSCQPTRRVLKFDTGIDLEISAANMVNPDRDGRASPVVIRVFKLKDQRQFSREDFLNLYEDADNRLGDDLLGTVILKELAPGETRRERITFSSEVEYVGLLAEFIRYQDAKAIQVLPITGHKINRYLVDLSGATLSAQSP